MHFLSLGALASTALAAVNDLTDATFAEFVESKDLTLVEFFAPWCGHCKALLPEYEKASEAIDAYEGANLALAKVDCTENTDICGQHEIRGYPTLVVFKGDKPVGKYDGARVADEISSFLIRRSKPVVQAIESTEALKTLEDPIIAIGIYDGAASNATFQSVAEGFRDRLKFVQLPAKFAADYKVKAPAVVVVKDETTESYAAKKFVEEDLQSFINVESFPAFGEIGPGNYLDYTQSGIPLLFAFVEDEEQRTNLEKWITPHLKQLHGKANIVFLDTDRFGAHAENVNIEQEFPALVVHDITSNKKYPHPQGSPLTAKTVKKYIEEYVGGKITPSIKSDEIPASQDGPVYILVAKEYDDVVLDKKRDVLVEYYAPWCGHCKNLSPIYDQLGKSYEGVDTVRIAKLDHTTNEIPDHIQGYPTIKLYPAGDKENPITFSGSRTFEDLQKFIQEKGTHKAVGKPLEESEEAEDEDELDHEDL